MVRVRYIVNDVNEAVAFYTSQLGFTVHQQFGSTIAILRREDLASWVVKLRADGVRFRNDIVEGPGGKQILCLDPSGNVVELFEPARSEK